MFRKNIVDPVHLPDVIEADIAPHKLSAADIKNAGVLAKHFAARQNLSLTHGYPTAPIFLQHFFINYISVIHK